MELARVIGTVVSTQKHPSINNYKILMIQPLNDDLKPIGEPLAAIDTVQAGYGTLVWWILKRESCYMMDDWFAPVDAAIGGIVDEVYQEDVGIKDRDEIFEKE